MSDRRRNEKEEEKEKKRMRSARKKLGTRNGTITRSG